MKTTAADREFIRTIAKGENWSDSDLSLRVLKDLDDAEAEIERLRAALLDIHVSDAGLESGGTVAFCQECGFAYPCRTVQALASSKPEIHSDSFSSRDAVEFLSPKPTPDGAL